MDIKQYYNNWFIIICDYISTRSKKEKGQLDNQISNMLIQIGTHIEDPIKRLEFIQDQTDQRVLRIN